MNTAQRGSLRDLARTPALSVTANLTVTLGEHSARLSATGQDLVLTASDPLAFWNAVSTADLPSEVGSINGPRALGRVADFLSDAGLTFRLVGPQGELVRLGAEGKSSMLAALTGSRSVELGAVSALFPLIKGWLGQTLTKRWGVLAALGGAVVLGTVASRRLRK